MAFYGFSKFFPVLKFIFSPLVGSIMQILHACFYACLLSTYFYVVLLNVVSCLFKYRHSQAKVSLTERAAKVSCS